MKKTLLSSLVAAVLLSGCGGDSGSTTTSTTTNTTNPPSTEVSANARTLLSSFTGSPTSYHLYNYMDGNILLDIQGLDTSFITANNLNLYDDGTVYAYHDRIKYRDQGFVNRAFVMVNPSDSAINANCLNAYTCYDPSTKTYYDLVAGNHSYDSKITAITNDGLTAVVLYRPDSQPTNVQIQRAYKEVSLSDIGIIPRIRPLLHQGIATDVLDFGYGSNGGDGFNGAYYRYNISGISIISGHFVIYNNGNVEVLNDYGTTIANGYVTNYYKRIPVESKDNIRFEYISGNTYYDNTNNVFYTLDGYARSNDPIVKITNDGNTAIQLSGQNPRIVMAYKKVE